MHSPHTAPPAHHAKVIACVNQKGGVGKTTTTQNLGAALAALGHTVLLVDLDADRYLSLACGLPPEHGHPTMADVLLDGRPLASVIQPTDEPRLAIAPADIRLADATESLLGRVARERTLAKTLAPVRAEYDVILLDCPPQLSLLSINAIVAADHYLVPVIPDYFGVEGIGNLNTSIAGIREAVGFGPTCLGILLTLVDYRPAFTRTVEATFRSQYGTGVFETVVTLNVDVKAAQEQGRSVLRYNRRASATLAYERLACEVEARLGLTTALAEAAS